tara:strand:+ start:1144 stop:1326 length:183 start_codon:yes stop_codon:yes gene_type:complete
MTANAVRAAFSKYTSRVNTINTCHGDDCLNNIDTEKYGYYVKPEIFHCKAGDISLGRSFN